MLSTRGLRFQLHSVQGRAKCQTDAASVPEHRELVTGTRADRSNSFLLPTVKNFQNRLTIDQVIAKIMHRAFLKHSI